jgi:hypothetical protein
MYCSAAGYKIYLLCEGTPWQPEFGGWAFNLPRGQSLLDKWNKIPADTDILVNLRTMLRNTGIQLIWGLGLQPATWSEPARQVEQNTSRHGRLGKFTYNVTEYSMNLGD